MFDNRKQSIPKVFIDKMAIDKKIEDVLVNSKVVAMDAVAGLIKQQRYLRADCARHIQKSKVTPNGGLA